VKSGEKAEKKRRKRGEKAEKAEKILFSYFCLKLQKKVILTQTNTFPPTKKFPPKKNFPPQNKKLSILRYFKI